MFRSLSYPDVELPPEKTVVVTGANCGIGYETAKIIAGMGAHVIIACRSEGKAKAAIEQMQKEHTEEQAKVKTDKRKVETLNVEYMNLDLSSLASTMAFIEAYKAKGYPLNILICNAGIMFGPDEITKDGFELHFQVNYLSHFLIVLHLLPVMKTSGSRGRIVMVSSMGHARATWDEKDLQSKNVTNRLERVYFNSKCYQVMQMFALSRRLEGSNIGVFSLCPGAVETEIFNRGHNEVPFYIRASMAVLKPLQYVRTARKGAYTPLTAALDPKYENETAIYFDSCKPKKVGALPRDQEKQEILWKYSLDCLKDYIKEDTLSCLNSP